VNGYSSTTDTDMTALLVNLAGLGLIGLIVWWFWSVRP
jgi:plastocyanin domain-containing protein